MVVRSWVVAFPVLASWKDSLDGGDGYLSPRALVFQNAERWIEQGGSAGGEAVGAAPSVGSSA